MRRLRILSVIILFSCSADNAKNIVMESELEQSRWTMEEELNSSFDCFKQLFIDTDSSYNSEQPKGQSQLFYRDFLKLKTTRDSIVNITGGLAKTEWLEILDQFGVKATRLRGSERAKEKIEKDLKFLNDNLDSIPESEFGELYKHIIERWTGETYKSVLSNAAIDFIEGRQPPCNL
jgi:hypothetical protein